MPGEGKRSVLGVLIDAADYGAAVDYIVQAAQEGRAATVSALAVHGVMTGVFDAEHRYRLNHFDLLVPDGQPVRWALNLLHRTRLRERVYGPALMLRLCGRAVAEGMAVYFYGSTAEVLLKLRRNLCARFPGLWIAGMEESRFRPLSPCEKKEIAQRVRRSGASIVFVGLGCPRQEIWAYEFRDVLSAPIISVGAAFPFLAGVVRQAPEWMQKRGLEWLFRFVVEPRRLWRRYMFNNPAYLLFVGLQAVGIFEFDTAGRKPSVEMLCG